MDMLPTQVASDLALVESALDVARVVGPRDGGPIVDRTSYEKAVEVALKHLTAASNYITPQENN